MAVDVPRSGRLASGIMIWRGRGYIVLERDRDTRWPDEVSRLRAAPKPNNVVSSPRALPLGLA